MSFGNPRVVNAKPLLYFFFYILLSQVLHIYLLLSKGNVPRGCEAGAENRRQAGNGEMKLAVSQL